MENKNNFRKYFALVLASVGLTATMLINPELGLASSSICLYIAYLFVERD